MYIGVIGHYGGNKSFYDGQTIKTKIVTKELGRVFGIDNIKKIDTYILKRKIYLLFFEINQILKTCSDIVILPAHNSLKIFTPIITIMNFFYKRKIHYVVVGGWLPDFLDTHKYLKNFLCKFDYIYVEVPKMKKILNKKGFKNVLIMKNSKELDILAENQLIYNENPPFKICTFSRVMQEKGISDIVEAVKMVNNKLEENIYYLDIYGQIDVEQRIWFEDLQRKFPDYIEYKGVADYKKTTSILKKYYALIFPTFYDGEGLAGTIIDAEASGVPIIASNWKYNSDIIVEWENGLLFKARDVSDLSCKLIEIVQCPEKWNNLKKLCLRDAKKYLPRNALVPLINNIKLNRRKND